MGLAMAQLMDVPYVHYCPYGLLMYVDASNFDDVVTYRIEVPADPLAYLTEIAEGRGAKVLRTRNVSRLDREGKKTGECKWCDFRVECIGDEAEGETGKRGNRGSALDTAVKRYIAAKADESEAKGLKDEQAETIKVEMRKRNAASLEVGEYKVTLSKMKGRRRQDRKALEAELQQHGVQLEDFETVGDPYEQLSIKERD
jgi:hypothetical protein